MVPAIDDSHGTGSEEGGFADLKSIQSLWQELAPFYQRWLASRGVPAHDADDILAACYLRLHTRSLAASAASIGAASEGPGPGIPLRGKMEAYLFATVQNAFRGWLIHRRREVTNGGTEELEELPSGTPDLEDGMIETEQGASMRRVFDLVQRAGDWLIEAGAREYPLDADSWRLFQVCIGAADKPVSECIAHYAADHQIDEAEAKRRFYLTAKLLRLFLKEIACHDPETNADLEMLGLVG